MNQQLDDLRRLSIADVSGLTGLSASSVYAEVAAGKFPQPLRFSTRCVRWEAGAIRQWLIDTAAAAQADSAVAEANKARAARASQAAMGVARRSRNSSTSNRLTSKLAEA